MTVTPLGNFLLVRPKTAQDEIKGGLVIPDTVAQDRTDMGEVIARGDDTTIQVGTKVIFNKYAPDEIFIDEVKHLLINQTDILATYAE
jgi:chaperonin GroES